jgi:hypothetical protein
MGIKSMKTVSRIIFAAAASSLAIAPIAAQAGTRASDSGSVYSVSAPGAGRAAKGESIEDDGGTIILALLAGAAIITGIVFATQSDDEGQSPGT